MPKLIKYFSELPSWFERSKYNEVHQLDEAGWHLQLSIRATLSNHLDSPDFSACEKTMKALNWLRLTPIIKTPIDLSLAHLVYSDTLELEKQQPKYSLGIHTMTINELFLLRHQIDYKKRTYMQDHWNKIENVDPDISFKIPAWADDPVVEDREIDRHPLCINLTLPDSILIEQFKKYLLILRDKTGTEDWLKPIKRHDFKDWVYFGVLQYIDLTIWAKENNYQISNRIMADAIFAEGEGGEDIVRKSVKPLAEWLLSSDSHSILATEAAIKIA